LLMVVGKGRVLRRKMRLETLRNRELVCMVLIGAAAALGLLG
jgi:hypothetical protein